MLRQKISKHSYQRGNDVDTETSKIERKIMYYSMHQRQTSIGENRTSIGISYVSLYNCVTVVKGIQVHVQAFFCFLTINTHAIPDDAV